MASQGPSAFLWVNKDANSTSLSKSEAAEKSSIFSHSQRAYHRERRRRLRPQGRQAKDASQKEATAVTQKSDSRPSALSSSDSPAVKTDSSRDSSIGHGTTVEDVTTSRSIIPHDSDGNVPQEIKIVQPIIGEGEALDPFHTASANIDRTTHTLLQYYITLGSPAKPNASSGHQNALHTATSLVVKDCIWDELTMRSILALTSSRMEHADGYTLDSASAVFMHKALVVMQESLQEASTLNGHYIYAMFLLYMAEAYRANISGALTHLEAAKALSDSLGGLHAIDKHLSSTLVGGGELYLAHQLVENHPRFPPMFDQPHATEALSEESNIFLLNPILESLAQGFLPSLNEDIANAEILEILEDMIEYAIIKHNAWVQDNSKVSVSEWLRFQSLGLRFRLMSLVASTWRLHALRITLMMWLTIVISHYGSTRSVQIATSHLHEVLTKIPPSAWTITSREILQWILIVGAMAAAGATEEQWFLGELSERLLLSDVAADLSGLRGLSERFFYIDPIQGTHLRNLAQKLPLVKSEPRTGALKDSENSAGH